MNNDGDGLNNIIEVSPAHFSDDEESDIEEYLVCIKNSKEAKPQYKVKKIIYNLPANWVSIKGSWDGWHEEIALKRFKNNFNGFSEFYVTMKISPGSYQFKFIADGSWVTSSDYPTIAVDEKIENNVLLVPANSTLSCAKPTNLEEKTYLNWRREESKWADCGSIHHTLQGHTMSVICDTVYIFGGMASSKFVNTMYTYDYNTNEFSLVEDQGGDVPDPRAFHQ